MHKLNKLKIQRYFMTGLVVFLPVWVTIYILYLIFIFVGNFFSPFVSLFFDLVGPEYFPLREFVLKLISFIATLGTILFTGFLITRYFGGKIVKFINTFFSRIPIAREIYSGFSRVLGLLLEGERTAFQRVVVIEFPRKGTFAVGFITDEQKWDLPTKPGELAYSVFVPTTPSPATGFFLLVPESQVYSTTITIDEALKLIISGGIIRPEKHSINTEPKGIPVQQPEL